jgi:LysM repeat protein
VQPGERLDDLMLRFDVSYRALRTANPSLSDQPQPGQRVCVPPAGSRGCRSLTLASGDSLERVAARLRTTPGMLLRLNPTMAPRDFVQGRVICID